MNVKLAREIIIKCLIDHNGTASSNDCEAAVAAAAKDDAERKAAKFAFNNGSYVLKQRGCVKAGSSRGVWEITDAGREFAKSGTLPAEQDKGEAPEAPKAKDGPVLAKTDTSDATAPATPEAKPEPAKRVKVAAAPVSTNPVLVPEWLKDDALRGMVIEASDCFGAWSAKSQSCSECPLAGWCRNAKASTLTLLASKLTTATPEAAAPVSKAAVKLDTAVASANAPAAPRAASVPEGGLMRAPHDGVCAKSGKPIKKGDQVKYIREVGLVLASEA